MSNVKPFFEYDWSNWLFGLVILLFAIYGVWLALRWIFVERLGIETKKMRLERESRELLKETSDRLTSLENKEASDMENTKEADARLKNDIDTLNSKLDKVSDALLQMKEDRDKDKLAEYKNNIGRQYREFHSRKYSDENPVPYWNSMEKEALNGLIEQYEMHGGTNSFVHTIVQPESETWILVDE